MSDDRTILLDAAFASSNDAIIIFRARDERIVDVNAAWSRVTGYPREKVIGRDQRTLDIWRDPNDSARLAAHLAEHGSVDGFEFAFTRHLPNGATELGYAVLTAQPVMLGEEMYVVAVGRDVTRERREREVRERARRLEELGRLAGGVAHDFNNLLTVIASYAELLQADAAAGEANPDDAVQIRRAAEAAASLTRRLVAFSRHQPVVPRRVDLGRTVQDAERMLTPLIGERNALVLDLAPDAPLVLADPGQVEQVLLNLVVNGRDALESDPAGGRITIRTGARVVERSEARRILGVEGAPGRYATLTVVDTGIGMDAATLARVFEPFFTTKPPEQGSGLGLAVVHGIVRQAGGAIVVDSAPGQGTTITIYWPAAGAEPVAQTPVPTAATFRESAARVLIVDDQAPVRSVARRVLVRAGYVVTEAADGVEALERLAVDGDMPDVVLSDLIMPRLDGHALAERLLERAPDLPVLLMSGYADRSAAFASLPNLVPRVLAKPFSAAELLEAVRTAIAREAEAESARPNR